MRAEYYSNNSHMIQIAGPAARRDSSPESARSGSFILESFRAGFGPLGLHHDYTNCIMGLLEFAAELVSPVSPPSVQTVRQLREGLQELFEVHALNKRRSRVYVQNELTGDRESLADRARRVAPLIRKLQLLQISENDAEPKLAWDRARVLLVTLEDEITRLPGGTAPREYQQSIAFVHTVAKAIEEHFEGTLAYEQLRAASRNIISYSGYLARIPDRYGITDSALVDELRSRSALRNTDIIERIVEHIRALSFPAELAPRSPEVQERAMQAIAWCHLLGEAVWGEEGWAARCSSNSFKLFEESSHHLSHDEREEFESDHRLFCEMSGRAA